VAALRAEGIRYVFGLPGGHSVTILYDELAKAGDIQAIVAEARENNLAIAAVDDFEARAVRLRDKAREKGDKAREKAVNKRYGATSTDMSE